MTENQTLEALFQQIRDVCAKEYKRGTDDARARILKAAGIDTETPKSIAVGVPRVTSKSAKAGPSVPRGLPERFVRRVLGQMPAGISPSEIIKHASSETEKRISYSAIRKALWKGREDGKYKNAAGKWSLA